MTPESLARSDTEAAHQTALFCWAAMNLRLYPELKWMHHIPNGGSRGDSVKSRMIQGAQLKQQGVKAGVADIFFPVKRGEYSGLYIEMKKPAERPKRTGRGGVSDEQQEFGDFVKSQGFGWCVCYDWQEASEVIKQYLNYPCGHKS